MSIFTQKAMAQGPGFPSKRTGTLGSFASSVWSPAAGSTGRCEESYHLLLELCAQEPTMQACFKIVESTCLARGIDMEIGGKPPSLEFRNFVSRFYLPFAESAIRYFFALGFVPWRLRKLCTGDVVPEAIPLGIFTWSIESIPNRVPRRSDRSNPQATTQGQHNDNGRFARPNERGGAASSSGTMDKHQMAAEQAFAKQKAYFSDPKRVPYPLQGDLMRMENRSDATKKAQNERIKGFAEEMRQQKGVGFEKGVDPNKLGEKRKAEIDYTGGQEPRKAVYKQHSHTPAYYRQRAALERQRLPPDDDDTKMLRCVLLFLLGETCNVLENEHCKTLFQVQHQLHVFHCFYSGKRATCLKMNIAKHFFRYSISFTCFIVFTR